MPLLQQIMQTQSMYSFYQDLLRKSMQPPNDPPPSFKSVLSIQTLNELARAKARTKPFQIQQKTFLTTQELLQPGVLDMYKKKGLVYIRRRVLSFRDSLRNPTLGCHIELLKYEEPFAYHVDSAKGRALMYRLCF